jgi:hypothetical protein
VLFTFIGVGMAVLVGFLADLLRKRAAKAAPQTPKATTRRQKVHVRLQHVLADNGALVRDGACSIMPVAGEALVPVAGEALAGGRSRSRGPPARRQSDEHGGGAHVGTAAVGTAAVGAAQKRGVQFAGWPDYAVLVSGTEPSDG